MFATTGTAAGADTILGSALNNAAGGGGPLSAPVTAPAGNGRYNVNLPVAGPAGSLALMVLGADYIVDLELSAAQREGKGEVISSPHIIAANQQQAVISQGTQIPYQESAFQRCRHHPVQERGARTEGDAADHPGQQVAA